MKRLERAMELFKAAGLRKQPPRPGLVPQSGDPEHPGRWVRPEDQQRAPRAMPGPMRGVMGPPGPASPDYDSPEEVYHGHADELYNVSNLLGDTEAAGVVERAADRLRANQRPVDAAKAHRSLDHARRLIFDEEESAVGGNKQALKDARKRIDRTMEQLDGLARSEEPGADQGDVQAMKEVRDPFAVATAQAQEMGYSDFSEGSEGEAKRDEIAEAVKEGKILTRRAVSLARGFRRLAGS